MADRTPATGRIARAFGFPAPLAVALLLAAALPGGAVAAEGPAARTLEEVLHATLASEESLQVAEAEVRKAELRSRRYLLYLTPEVQLQGSYTRSGVQDADADGASAEKAVAWGLALTQPLYTGGRATAAYRGQKKIEASQRLEAELTRRGLVVAVTQAYYRVLAAAEAVGVGEQAVGLARRQLARAARRVELGDAVLNDQLRAEVSLRRLEAELSGFRSALAQGREEIRRLSGLSLASDPAVPPPQPQIAGSDESLVAEALGARREPEQARLAVAAAEEDVREKQGRYLPSLVLNASWGESGEKLRDQSWAWSAGVALVVPIYQSGSTTYELRESRVGLAQERLRAGGSSRDVEREVRGLLRELEAARSRRESLQLAVVAAAENLRLSERRYEVGLAESLEVADAQNADVAARVDLVAAGYAIEALTVQLRNALGRELLPVPGNAEPGR